MDGMATLRRRLFRTSSFGPKRLDDAGTSSPLPSPKSRREVWTTLLAGPPSAEVETVKIDSFVDLENVKWNAIKQMGTIFLLVFSMVFATARVTGFPVAPGLLLVIVIHIIIFPFSYNTNLMVARLTASTRLLEEAAVKRAALSALVAELVRLAPIVIWIQHDGQTLYVSEHMRDFLGVEPKDCLGREWVKFLHPDDRAASLERTDSGLDYFGITNPEESALRGELIRFVRPDGEIRFADVRQRGFGDGIVLGALFDVTAIKESEARLERALRVREEVVANVSHELRSPLNGIIGLTDSVLNDDVTGRLTGEQREMLNEVLDCSKGLLSIVNDLLLLSRIESAGGQIEIVEEEFDPIQFGEKMAGMFKQRSKEKNVDMKLKVLGSENLEAPEGEMAEEKWISPPPRKAVADIGRLRQCVINLLSNAFKFTDKGSITLSVGFQESEEPQSCSEADDDRPDRLVNLHLLVTDTGCGIPDAFFPSLFSKFTQADYSASRIHQGAGLGLSIVRGLVVAMNGKVDCESAVGKGSTFRIVVPVRIPKHQVVEEVKEPLKEELVVKTNGFHSPFDGPPILALQGNPTTPIQSIELQSPNPEDSASQASGTLISPFAHRSGTLSSTISSSTSLQLSSELLPHSDPAPRLKILAVEDNAVNMRVLMKYLLRLGSEIPLESHQAWDGVEAVEAVKHGTSRYDLVLCDLQLPLLDGFGASKRMRDPEEVPIELQPELIVACTANTMDKDIERCKEAGMEDFLSKPIMLDQLKRVIESAWKRKLKRLLGTL